MTQHVLVVEDEALAAMALEDVLSSEGFRVTLAENGEAALAAFRRDPPDVVLLDISLPGMSGVDLLRLMRQDAALAGGPVIALTAHAMAGDRDAYLGAGCDAYVAKPIVDETELLSAIDRLSARSR